MNTIDEKISKIFDSIMDLQDENPAIHALFLEGFSLSIELISELQRVGSREDIDLSKHLEIITNVLGISLHDVVAEILKDMKNENSESTKNPDQETLDFITSDLDDYEKFIAKNSSKESLDFLTKEI
jgi:hypothetical protein